MPKEQGSNEKSALVKLRQDLGKVLMKEGSNQFCVSLQIFCPTQDVIFFLIFGIISPVVHSFFLSFRSLCK